MRFALDPRHDQGSVELAEGFSLLVGLPGRAVAPVFAEKEPVLLGLRLVDLEAFAAFLLSRELLAAAEQLPDLLYVGWGFHLQQDVDVEHRL